MAFPAKSLVTTLFGRRLGIAGMSTNQTGGLLQADFLVGAEDVQKLSSTADTTTNGLRAFGVSLLTTGLSVDTTSVFRLDPPIPGVEKTIVWGSTTVGTMGSKIFVTISTGNGGGFQTSNGSSFSCVASSNGNVLRLMGLTTAIYAVVNGSTGSGFGYTTTT